MSELAAPRKTIQILRPIQVQQGDKRIALYPSDSFKVSYTISFDHPLLRHQQKTLDLDEQTFVDEIAPARTFGFLKEVEMLRQRGLALGGSLENAIVLGETGVLNPLRFEDEFVRHKILDVIGDLALWAIRCSATWSCTAAVTRSTRPLRPSCCVSAMLAVRRDGRPSSVCGRAARLRRPRARPSHNQALSQAPPVALFLAASLSARSSSCARPRTG